MRIPVYVVQSVLPTLPHLKAVAVSKPPHELLGADPEAALAELAHALRKSAGGEGENAASEADYWKRKGGEGLSPK